MVINGNSCLKRNRRIMKKKYINPTMEVVEIKVNTNLLLVVSGTEVDGGNALAPDYDVEIPEPPYLMLPE